MQPGDDGRWWSRFGMVDGTGVANDIHGFRLVGWDLHLFICFIELLAPFFKSLATSTNQQMNHLIGHLMR
ncbi:MAG: hypothetical protein WEA56_08130 [Balneolaceae bacterium]